MIDESSRDRTNHSIRKSTIKTLCKAGVARDKVKNVTGHKSTHSIEAYDDRLSDDEQWNLLLCQSPNHLLQQVILNVFIKVS